MKRRTFLKLGVAGAATIAIGRIPGLGVTNAYAAVQNLTISITDGRKDMVTKNAVSALIVDPNPVPAQCYFWVYKMTADGVDLPPDCPGPTICAMKGDTINVSITNNLDEPHSFYIPGIFDSGAIAPGDTFSGTLTASVSGAHLYYDNLNAPVNRVMGLHGGMVVRPTAAAPGHNFTPYDNPSPHVQALYDSFGSSFFPGLKWEQGDPATNTPAFRQYVWCLHQASPNLFAEVGDLPPGEIYDAQLFQQKFLRDPFSFTRANNIPQYFTINGQSGFFSHFSPTITPIGRVGEPIVIHMMNAGLWTHSMHYHFNHFYVTYDNGVSQNPFWVDIYNVDPMDTVDYTLPFQRPPNVPNVRGIGLPDTPMQTINGHPCWPPIEEMAIHMPFNKKASDINGNDVSLDQLQSPLCYPMHDHAEASQTSQGGNYNCGLISGAYCTGDRNTPGFMDFPMEPDFAMMYRNIRGVSVERGTLPAPGTPPV
ncbi:MAG: multicopper oxidase domain-containing protein [Geobacteraceae bacterium]|nr:multicopper oxidase domain-containing protein [Geobacteraceae bacterium]